MALKSFWRKRNSVPLLAFSRICLRAMAWAFFVLFSIAAMPAIAASKLEDHFESAVVLDATTGEVLYSHQPHQKVIPASLVKLMVALIAVERAQQGQLDLNEKHTVSAAASRIGGHHVFLKQGEVFTLEELLKAVIIASANDAAFAVAEHVGGTADRFVTFMNQRAKQLNMRDTEFHNVHGLPPNKRKGQKDNISSAYDLGVLARHVTKYPLILQWSSTRLDWFRDGTFQLLNTNHRFLRDVTGADGLKTGYHPRGAGFNLVGTAVRDGRRLITVVMGSPTSKDRLKAATTLMEKQFTPKTTLP